MNGKFLYYIRRALYIPQTYLCHVLRTLCRMYELEMVQQNPQVRVEDVREQYEERFPEWFKSYVSFAPICCTHIEDAFLLCEDNDNIFDYGWL